jgi:hypothetical protein
MVRPTHLTGGIPSEADSRFLENLRKLQVSLEDHSSNLIERHTLALDCVDATLHAVDSLKRELQTILKFHRF